MGRTRSTKGPMNQLKELNPRHKEIKARARELGIGQSTRALPPPESETNDSEGL